MFWYGVAPTWRLLVLPFLVLVAFSAAVGAGVWFAAINVKYRDVRYIVPFIVQFGLYVSPVGFSSVLSCREVGDFLYSMNPMVGIIDGFRWAILGGEATIYWPGFLLSLGLVIALLFSGVWYFRTTERTFADFI